MRKNQRKLSLDRQVVRNLGDLDLRRVVGGLMADTFGNEKSCDPCGDWPTSPYLGCTL